MPKLVPALLVALLVAAPAAAQTEAPPVLVVAVPALATPKDESTSAGSTWAIANRIAELIAKDLQSSGRFLPVNVKSIRSPSYPEVTAPHYRPGATPAPARWSRASSRRAPTAG